MLIVFQVCFFVVIGLIVTKLLMKAQNSNAPTSEELVGVKAMVTESISLGGFGEITYEVKGNNFNSPAKATNGSEIKAGNEVAITWIENYVFYVAGLGEN